MKTFTETKEEYLKNTLNNLVLNYVKDFEFDLQNLENSFVDDELIHRSIQLCDNFKQETFYIYSNLNELDHDNLEKEIKEHFKKSNYDITRNEIIDLKSNLYNQLVFSLRDIANSKIEHFQYDIEELQNNALEQFKKEYLANTTEYFLSSYMDDLERYLRDNADDMDIYLNDFLNERMESILDKSFFNKEDIQNHIITSFDEEGFLSKISIDAMYEELIKEIRPVLYEYTNEELLNIDKYISKENALSI